MNLGLQDKVILVSGGGGLPGSIGRSMVESAAREGAIPVILDAHPRGQEIVATLAEVGAESLFLQTDLTRAEDCERAVRDTLHRYGRIDVLINNLGINDGVGLEGDAEAFLHSLKLNLVHMFLLAKHSREALIASRGVILNIGSKVAQTGQGGTSGYAAAKGGVLALTREWAVELAKHGIRVNALILAECWGPAYQIWISKRPNPEAVLEQITARIPLGNRMTQPEEVADYALFLVSERASHLTGQHLFLDGGYVHLDRALQALNT